MTLTFIAPRETKEVTLKLKYTECSAVNPDGFYSSSLRGHYWRSFFFSWGARWVMCDAYSWSSGGMDSSPRQC